MKMQCPNIAKEGYIFIIISFVITIIGFLISTPLGIILAGVTVWVALFFRDPKRITPQIPEAIIAPADGIINCISVCSPPKEISEELQQEEMLKISIFMNVFNVHMNRAPIGGVIQNIHYIAGKFFNASLDKASEHNERQIFVLKTENNTPVIMVQIAGLIARRIVKFVTEEQPVQAGEKIGLIRFGSRVDVYLPKHVVPLVALGQTTIGGETILASIGNMQPNTIKTAVLDRPTTSEIV